MSDIVRKLRVQQMLRDFADEPLTLNEYQKFALQTDTTTKFVPGPEGIPFLALGLFGEVGSLLSELKKQRRDKEPHELYTQNQVEEFGDVLWYFSTLAARASRTLEGIAQAAMVMADHGFPVYTGAAEPTTFLDLQVGTNAAADDESMLSSLLDLGFHAGQIVGDSNKTGPEKQDLELLGNSLQSFFDASSMQRTAQICRWTPPR